MSSIYQKALGSDFERLHPKIQERFGFSSLDAVACIGRGVMDEIWHGRFYTLPFLYVGTWRRIMFPERGQSVPFTVEWNKMAAHEIPDDIKPMRSERRD